jgi:hypothetical protein
MEQMWARLWGKREQVSECQVGGGGDVVLGGGSWKTFHEKVRNVWKKMHKKTSEDGITVIDDNLNSSIDSGLGSESHSIKFDHCEQAIDSEISRDDEDDNMALPSIYKLHHFQPSLVSSSQSLFTSPTPSAPVSIIKSQRPQGVKIKKSISFCETSNSQTKRRPVR